MCKTMGVSRSGFYDWQRRPLSTHEQENQTLMETIKTIHAQSRGTYGTPRIQVELREQGQTVSRRRIGRLMHKAGLTVRFKRKTRNTTNSKHRHPVADNRLERNFTATQPNQKWTTDITYLPLRAGRT
jgi:putative transposase